MIVCQPRHEEGTADNVTRHSVFIGQRTVHGQTPKLPFSVADQRNRVVKGIDSFDVAAYDLLHGLQTAVDLLHRGRLHRLHDEDFDLFLVDKASSFSK